MGALLRLYLVAMMLQIPVGGGVLGSPNLATAVFGALDAAVFVVSVAAYLGSKGSLNKRLFRVAAVVSLFSLWAALTSIWAQTPEAGYGLLLLGRDVARFWSVLLICSTLSTQRAKGAILGALLWAGVLYPVLFAATASFAYDFESSEGRLMYAGYKDANGPSRDLAFLALFAYWHIVNRFRQRTHLAYGAIALSVVAFALSFSKAATIALMLGALVLTISKFGLTKRVAIRVLWLGVVCVALILYRYSYILSYVSEVQGGTALTSLSGRTLIWQIFWDNLGVGYIWGMGINSFSAFSTDLSNNPGSVHNELMQISFSYGVVGLFLYFGIARTVFRHLARDWSNPARSLVLGSLTFYAVVGFTESNQVTSVFPFYLLLLLLVLHFAYSVGTQTQAQPVRTASAGKSAYTPTSGETV